MKSFPQALNVKIEENTQEAEEVLKSPVNKEIGIVRYYYNQEDDIAKKEQSLILFALKKIQAKLTNVNVKIV